MVIRHIFCMIAAAFALRLWAAGPAISLSFRWGAEFQLKSTENGDTICIAAVNADSTGIYLYDLAQGRLVVIDSAGTIAARIKLQSTGRSTYAGDDFIVRTGQALFLNAVDRRIEVFALSDGSHVKSIPYPQDALKSEPKRICRIINRIFLDGDRILLGNERRLFVLDEWLGKIAVSAAIRKTATGQKFLLVNSARTTVITGSRISANGIARGKEITTRYPMWGKRYCEFKGRLLCVSLDASGVKISEIR
jgi:hypothetical protein